MQGCRGALKVADPQFDPHGNFGPNVCLVPSGFLQPSVNALMSPMTPRITPNTISNNPIISKLPVWGAPRSSRYQVPGSQPLHDPVAAMVQVALECVAEVVGAHYMYQKIVSK